ncbi:Transcriptional regulatory protein moc3 [Lachnellula cervina]|uniref:Transcriptional regulatory protein moc3 n=1 Tax=Lachnellula cervina TaxID=1316786 RepID=A0A7D8YMW9_9HELO|nr:Transcriptional regulatory protein moc3 [Lachnellula cervina]
MSLRHPFPNVYKFFNQFADPTQSSPEQSSRSQGLRKSGPRSKTGCSTCKQRRVKCDETKPGCIRCQNLGRECGGYQVEANADSEKPVAPVAIHPRPVSVMPYAPSSAIPGNQEERRYFQRFCDKTSGEIAGEFDPTFWTEKVLQLCHTDAPIRYATIALGALAKSLEVTSFPTRLSLSGFPQIDVRHLDEHHSYALRQYSRAIGALRTVLSDGRRHLRTSLTSCVLFMTFEALQGSYDGSLTHLRGGSRLLADWRTARKGQSSRLSQDSLSEIQDGLVDDLGRLFARLDVQGLFVPPPYPMPECDWEDVVIADYFSTFHEAKESFDFLMQGIAQFYLKSIGHAQQHPDILASTFWINQHTHYSNKLNQWRSAFQVVHAGETKNGAVLTEATNVLSIYYNLATVLLASSVQHSEMLYDEFEALFAEIITKSHQLLTNPDEPTNTARYTLDMGTILPLAITAIKCRNKRIRRQSIALLWSKARREGLCFDTITVARLCAWLSSIEGEGILEESETIPESARYVVTYLHINSEERWLAVQLTSAIAKEDGTLSYRETTFSW